jgi:hypothetical protein
MEMCNMMLKKSCKARIFSWKLFNQSLYEEITNLQTYEIHNLDNFGIPKWKSHVKITISM